MRFPGSVTRTRAAIGAELPGAVPGLLQAVPGIGFQAADARSDGKLARWSGVRHGQLACLTA
jgi:hypothetical protein